MLVQIIITESLQNNHNSRALIAQLDRGFSDRCPVESFSYLDLDQNEALGAVQECSPVHI